MSFDTQNLLLRRLASHDLELTDENRAYQTALVHFKDDLIRDYNYMIDVVIPGILKRKFHTKDGIIDVKGVSIRMPQITGSKTGNHLMTPKIARDTLSTYECDIYIDYVLIKSQQGQPTMQGQIGNTVAYVDGDIKTMRLGSIHSMVNANRCLTSHKPPEFRSLEEWKMFLCECPASPGSYFINKGAEKFVIHDEKLRTNTFLTFMTKGDSPHVETRITCLDNSKTTLVRLQVGKHLPTIKVMFPHLKGKHYPLYFTFFLLIFTYNTTTVKKVNFDIDIFENYIAIFAEKEHREQIIAYLEPSKIKFKKLFMVMNPDGSYRVNEEAIQAYSFMKLTGKKTYSSQTDAKNYVLSNISENVPNEMFINCYSYKDKFANLCAMTCQTVLCALGIREFDSRDGWGEKKIDSAVRKITHYVAEVLTGAIKNGKPIDDNTSLGKGDKNEVIIEARKCETVNSAIGERDKIKTQVDSRTNSKTLREVSQKQPPFICPVKTPEGEDCGLSKEKAALTHLSLNREYEENRKLPINDLFEPYIQYYSSTQDFNFAYKLIFVTPDNRICQVCFGPDNQNVSTNIFFSKRIINILKKYVANKQAIYYISDDSITVRFNYDIKMGYQYFSCHFGGYIFAYIPDIMYADFQIISQRVANPEFQLYSTVSVNEQCEFKLATSINGVLQYVKIQHGGNTFDICVSRKFITTLQGRIERADINVKGDTCIMDFGNRAELVKVDTYKHWSGAIISNCCIPSKNMKLFEGMFSMITDYLSTIRNKRFDYSFTFNGNVLTSPYTESFYPAIMWVDGPKLLKYLKACRRSKLFPIDSCIHINEKDKIIQFFDDPGRVMAPMLVVDENGDLVADNLGTWSRFKERNFKISDELIEGMYAEGSLEMIDAKEMDTVLLAENIEECRRFAKLRKFLNSLNITQLKSSLLMSDDGYIINEDVVNVTINGNKFNVEYSMQDPGYECVTYNDGENIYYATYTFEKTIYEEYKGVVHMLVRPVNGYRMDGMYMVYFRNGSYHFITHESDEETDGKFVYFGEDRYKIEYLQFPKGMNVIYRGENLVKIDVYSFTRPQFENSRANSHVNSRANSPVQDLPEKEYYVYNNVFYPEDEIVDKHFVMVDGKYQLVEVVRFPEGKMETYFDKNRKSTAKKDDGKKKQTPFNKINEFIPPNVRLNMKMYVERDEIYDARECKLHNANIRRFIEDLDVIDFNVDPNIILSNLKENIPAFGSRRIMYNLRKYLNTEFKFTHCLLDPNAAFSVIANFVPKADSNPGPRFTYQCAMGTQALGVNNSVWYTRYETSNKRLVSPCEHSFETIAELPLSQCTMPTTQNMVIGVLCHRKGFEDPVLLSRSAYEKFGIYEKEVCIQVIESSSDIIDRVCYPTDSQGNIKSGPKFERYRHLELTGLPKLGAYIKTGDCIVGKTKFVMNDKRIDSSYFAGVGEEGIVTDVKITASESAQGTFRIVTIKLKQYRHQQPGDKMASRYSQKGTIGDIIGGMIMSGDPRLQIIDDNKMPYVRGGPNHGLRCDVVFNPASFPSRMTMGLVDEILTSKAALYLQEKVNASNFHKLDLDYYKDALYEHGLDINCNELLCHSDGEIMMDQTTGMPFQAFIGIVAYQFLRHHVIDKETARATGPVKSITQQPNEGRKKNGGQRMGEMERDALLSSGASETLFDRFMVASDGYVDVFCYNCKNNSSMSNIERNVCHVCNIAGCLVRVDEPRIYSVFCLQMNAIGLNVLQTMVPEDDFEAETAQKMKEQAMENSELDIFGDQEEILLQQVGQIPQPGLFIAQ